MKHLDYPATRPPTNHRNVRFARTPLTAACVVNEHPTITRAREIIGLAPSGAAAPRRRFGSLAFTA